MLWTFTCADNIIYSSIVNMTFSSFPTSDYQFHYNYNNNKFTESTNESFSFILLNFYNGHDTE